ncbi:helix-turn-helix transcriptional regulator [Paenibacillus eucommiae]|uniref:AraC-like DNA-binding protein n=1 Tax=Paenibacillus eucommiae TaxID=1355755 RepID=A0ABS4IW58_9BACL|nr:AraC family transcriptional regulator [Paenibacillus eucommiae]MBP1991076.1 AraC-like DNA-binding protein [Paenibacillus eucommiae]
MKPLPFSLQRNSLFNKLLAGFLSIIVLLLSFNFFSYSFFKSNIQQEIIDNNQQNLSNTVERYENHIRIIQAAVIRLYFDERVILLNELGSGHLFDPVKQVMEEIRKITDNDLLYVDNIIFQFNKNAFVLEKNGPSSTDQFFSNNYVSTDYDVEFWRDQLYEAYPMRMFKQSDFKEKSGNRRFGSLLPIIFKNDIYNQYYIAVLLNPVKLHQAFRNSNQSKFYIIDSTGQQLFGSTAEPLPAIAVAQAEDREVYAQHDELYYFYKKGTMTGLTYVTVIPKGNIAAQVSRLNMILLTLLVVAVSLSILISIILSVKFNHPIQQMKHAVQRYNPHLPLQTKIDEYNFIYNQIHHIMQTNQEIQVDLDQKKSQLRHLGYLNKLKNIYSNLHDGEEPNKPHYFILFQLTITRQFRQLIPAEQERATYFLREFISIALSDSYADTITFQVEHDQILSLIFTEKEAGGLIDTLHRLKRVFDQDRDYFSLTVAVQPTLRHPAEFTASYQQALEMAGSRKLNSETQIITEMNLEPADCGFSAAQEKEFLANLQAGNGLIVMEMVVRILGKMEKKEASVSQFTDFAKDVVAKVLKTMISLNLDISLVFTTDTPYQRIKECTSLQHYSELFEWFLSEAVQMIVEKREGTEPVKKFLTEFIHAHYNEDISLEMMAEKANMSANYFSKYFKDKTGMNFSDYLSELRIQKAKEMLIHSDLRIQEISEKVGYLNTNSFIRMFKKITGTPPGEYKRMHTIKEKDA